MMTEERHEKILNYLKGKERASQQELLDLLGTSESTLRRDLMTLEEQGLLHRIRGGVTCKKRTAVSDSRLASRRDEHQKEKQDIAMQAVRQIQDGETIYFDAGSTVEALLPMLAGKEIQAVTDSISHAMQLMELGIPVSLTGGELKSTTNALVGEEALEFLDKYRFSKGFFGANAITEDGELLTPDVREAAVKKKALDRTLDPYILADSSKFDQTAAVRFGDLSRAVLVTEKDAQIPEGFPGLILRTAEETDTEETPDETLNNR